MFRIVKNNLIITFGIVLLVYSVAFFIQKQYWQSFFVLIIMLILFKLEDLKRIIFSPNKVEAEFNKIQVEKIKEEIKQNKEEVTKEKVELYRGVEDKILNDIHKKLGGELKREINFVALDGLGGIDFRFLPDGVIRLDDEMIFIEIKSIRYIGMAKSIIEQGIKYLELVLRRFELVAGVKIRAKLVLATKFDINLSQFVKPNNIDVEIYKI